MTPPQRPETSNGDIFVSLEDEEGEIHLIVYRTISEKPVLRPVVLGSRLMAVKGRWQKKGNVCNIIAKTHGRPNAHVGRTPHKEQRLQMRIERLELVRSTCGTCMRKSLCLVDLVVEPIGI